MKKGALFRALIDASAAAGGGDDDGSFSYLLMVGAINDARLNWRNEDFLSEWIYGEELLAISCLAWSNNKMVDRGCVPL